MAYVVYNLIPPCRTGHVAVPYENYMLVWGGYKQQVSSQENLEVLASIYFNGSDLWIYSALSENWYLKKCLSGEPPPGLSGSTAVVIDSALYLFGGYDYNLESCTNKLYKLDLETFAWESLKPAGNLPSPVDKMAGWHYDKKFYVFGGFGNPDNISAYDFQFVFYNLLWRGWTNQFYAYDPKENKWIRPICSGTSPSARAAHAAAVMGDKVYIFGGRLDACRLNDLHCLDMKTMTWSGKIAVNGPVPEERSWHSLTALSHQFLILYGGFSQKNAALSDCWMYDTIAQVWHPIELPFVKPRLWHSACLNNFNEVLVYGGCTSNILDLERKPGQANDIIAIRIAPKSLYRICMDRVASLPMLEPMLTCLPHNVQKALHLKMGLLFLSNLDGS